jgi:hypothetical protein
MLGATRVGRHRLKDARSHNKNPALLRVFFARGVRMFRQWRVHWLTMNTCGSV